MRSISDFSYGFGNVTYQKPVRVVKRSGDILSVPKQTGKHTTTSLGTIFPARQFDSVFVRNLMPELRNPSVLTVLGWRYAMSEAIKDIREEIKDRVEGREGEEQRQGDGDDQGEFDEQSDEAEKRLEQVLEILEMENEKITLLDYYQNVLLGV